MSERSLSLTAVPARAGDADGGSGSLLQSLAPLLADWLPKQRWFAGKGRPISGFALVSATEVLPCAAGGAAPGLLHLLVRAHQPAADEEADGTAPTEDCYQLLLGVRGVLPPRLAPALIGRPSRGPMRGLTVYEALQDPRLAGLLLERMRAPGRLGPLLFAREPQAAIPSGLPSRPLSTEQSNSSVVYGSSYILKVFRRVGPGVNPDLELPLALSRLGCGRVPAPTAWFEARLDESAAAGRPGGESVRNGDDGERPEGRVGPRLGEGRDSREGRNSWEGRGSGGEEAFTLGVLQPFLPGSCDGWQLALHALAERLDFTTAAHALGCATAEVHTGLADALPTAVLHRPQLEQLASDMADRLEAAAGAVPVLRPYRTALRDAFHAVAELGRGGHRCRAQRVHGDLHLGQVLRGADGRWTLIDFEGEPDRPLGERRTPQPVVRDVAGMLRSFDYAASHRTEGPDGSGPEDWANANRAAYCAGYGEASGTDPRDEAVLLRAYETDKAIYEVLYEARHRPSWLPIPMSAIRRLAAPPRRNPL